MWVLAHLGKQKRAAQAALFVWCRRWDTSAQEPPQAPVGLGMAPAGAHLTRCGFSPTLTNKKEQHKLLFLFGAGGGTPRPKSRRKRRLASEWRLRARISPDVGSRPP